MSFWCNGWQCSGGDEAGGGKPCDPTQGRVAFGTRDGPDWKRMLLVVNKIFVSYTQVLNLKNNHHWEEREQLGRLLFDCLSWDSKLGPWICS